MLHPENVNAIVEEAVRFFAPEIEDRDIVVEQELRSDLPLLELDRDQMKQVFYNVIKNSFEAMKRRGILRIRTDMDATHVNISFTDTGGGMSAESLSRVFEPYFTTKEFRLRPRSADRAPHRARTRRRNGDREQRRQGTDAYDSIAVSRQARAHAGSGGATERRKAEGGRRKVE